MEKASDVSVKGMTPCPRSQQAILVNLAGMFGWKIATPPDIRYDADIGRYFIKGAEAADFWVRDKDIEALKKTPMWEKIVNASYTGPVAKQESASVPAAADVEAKLQAEREHLAEKRKAAEEKIHRLDDWE